MKLRFLGKNSTPDESPTLYATDQDSYVVQGWIVTDVAILASEPITDYIRFEWLDAAQLVRAGEDVRWLPRRNASKLLLPGNDCWMFDRQMVAFTHFSGDGHVLDHEMTTDPDVVEACAVAFEEAWEIAIPHHEYTPS